MEIALSRVYRHDCKLLMRKSRAYNLKFRSQPRRVTAEAWDGAWATTQTSRDISKRVISRHGTTFVYPHNHLDNLIRKSRETLILDNDTHALPAMIP